MKNYFKIKNYEKIAWRIIALGFVILLIAIILFLHDSFNFLAPIDADKFDAFGSFIGGFVGALFSLAGILLVLATLNIQKKQFEDLQKQSTKQQIENHFFSLLKIYQEEKLKTEINTNTLGYILKNFSVILESVRENLSTFDVNEKDQINIAYLVFFFGFNDIDMKKSLKGVLTESNVEPKIISAIIDNNVLRITKQQEDDSGPGFISSPGYSNTLGHYFRQLFHLINYIGENKALNPQERYFYLRIFRTQMSDQEQALFFFNSLSYLGRRWKRGLIIKYKLIHNAPDALFFNVDRIKYYPITRP